MMMSMGSSFLPIVVFPHRVVLSWNVSSSAVGSCPADVGWSNVMIGDDAMVGTCLVFLSKEVNAYIQGNALVNVEQMVNVMMEFFALLLALSDSVNVLEVSVATGMTFAAVVVAALILPGDLYLHLFPQLMR